MFPLRTSNQSNSIKCTKFHLVMHNIHGATRVGTEFKQRFLPLKQIKEVRDYCAFSYYFAHCRSQSQLSYLLQSPLSAWLSTPLVSVTYWSQQCTSFARHFTKSKTSRLETPVQVCSFYALHYTEFLIKQCRMHVRHYCPPVTTNSCHFQPAVWRGWLWFPPHGMLNKLLCALVPPSPP